MAYFFTVIAIIGIFNIYLNHNNYQISAQFEASVNQYYRINYLLSRADESKTMAELYLKDKEEENKLEYEELQSEVFGVIREFENKQQSLEAYFLLTAIRNSSKKMYVFWNEAVKERSEGKASYFTTYYEGEKIWGYLKAYMEEYLYIYLEEGDALYSKLAREADITRRVSVVLILGSSLFALFIGMVFIQSFIDPIKRLAYNSKRMASGDLEVPELIIRNKDEVGVLGESFNSMSKSIREYVNELEEKVVIEKKLHEEELELVRMEQLLKEAQFETLQSQINPHFLFNTLNTISRTAMFEKANDTMKLIQALSGLFRYKLRSQSTVISLKEELSNAEEYIFLQKYRFKDRLAYEIIADESTGKVEIPIFFLQPLLENAIIHGIEPKIEGGKIRIKIVTRCIEGNEWVIIRITDTGVGIRRERLAQILDFHEEKKMSIGVSNVYHRFFLMYGDQGKFRMLSKEGLGTFVEFRIKREGHYEAE